MNDPATKLPPLPDDVIAQMREAHKYCAGELEGTRIALAGRERQLSLALELLRDAKYFVRYADEVGDGYSAKEWIERLSKSGLLGEIGGRG